MKGKTRRSTCRRGNFSAFREHRSGFCAPTLAFLGDELKHRRGQATANGVQS
jgi:hypothetical protein